MTRMRFFACLLMLGMSMLESDPSLCDSSGVGSGDVTQFDVNGLKVIVKQRPKSRTVALGLFVRGGSSNINASNAGIESLLLRVSSDASVRFPRRMLRAELAHMGSSISYATNNDYSVLSLACVRANFDRSWEVFADAAIHPALNPQDVELDKSQMIATLRGQADDPDSALQSLQAHASYAGHPYENQPDGTPASLEKLTADDLRLYHQKVMQNSHLLLVVVGSVDVADLRRKVAATFGLLPKGVYNVSGVPMLAFASSHVEVLARELPTNYIQGIYAAPVLTSPDTDALLVASEILNERVFEEIRVKRNLSYAPSAFFWKRSAPSGGIYVTAVDANQAVKVMRDQIALLQKKPASAQELSGVAGSFLTKYYLAIESNAAQVGELAQYELTGGGWQRSETNLERVRAVTPADVQRVATRYMNNLQFAVVGNELSINRQAFTGQQVQSSQTQP
jgi:zinc protease